MMIRILLLLSATFLSAREITNSYDYEPLSEIIFHGDGKMEINQGAKNHLEISAEELNTSMRGSGHVDFLNYQEPPRILNETIEGNEKVSVYRERIKK